MRIVQMCMACFVTRFSVLDHDAHRDVLSSHGCQLC